MISENTLLKSLEIDSKDKLEQAINLVMAKASERPWLDDSSLTEVCRECKKISIPKHTKLSYGISFTFGEILLKNICSEFDKLANLKHRAKYIAECYKGPVELKENWIKLRFEELLPVQKHSVSRRIQFCSYLFLLGMISPECIITIMEILISARNGQNLQNFSIKCLWELIHSLLQRYWGGDGYEPVDFFFHRPSIYDRLSDILDRLRGSCKENAKNFVSLPAIRNIIKNIKLEIEEDEIAKVRREAEKQNQLRLNEEKRNQKRLENEKRRQLILSQGPLRSVDEMEEKDFDCAMIVDLFN